MAISFMTVCAVRPDSKRWSKRLTRPKQSQRSEDRQLLRQAEAAQCLQGRSCVHGRWLAASSGCNSGLSIFRHSNWAVRLVVLAIVAGFPIALVIAWAFELTPQGLKRTEDVDLAAQGQRKSHAWIYVVIVGAALSIGLFFLGRYTAQHAGGGAAATDKSIAVLPFANLSHDPENVYFAAGIEDEIITRLAKIADLKVISCTSTQRFKSSPDDIPAIAGQVGVANILEGSVQNRRSGACKCAADQGHRDSIFGRTPSIAN